VSGEGRQCEALEVLHRQKRQAVRRPAQVEDPNHMGVIDARDGPRLLLEPTVGVDVLGRSRWTIFTAAAFPVVH
jgi:hypothetical protein